ncbi:sugar transporter permease [Micromonospora globispora]|uniref:Maltose/maltodextrin transport system permease protein n=1 Tax=Micromonospora globispora TaxID=1450148 RepID=A0A317KFJ8_9ACTN|nr:ABC transporter permease subunit [Micromonospora globispora]PWU52320.1 sugar transporter permease [Micromonospora globispora]PWU60407.1 sugar transporter permease [Micromonospora globispora]RQW93358.1 sugar transporter permease [Micromonospora globispora]
MSTSLSGPGSAMQAPGRGPVRTGLPRKSRNARNHAPITATGLVVKVILLGLVAGIAIWAAFPLIEAKMWVGLGILAATTAGLFYLYLTRRHIPAKYLVPGTLFLLAFQVIPILYTATTAFTNFGDGHRGSKDDAIVAIQTSSVKQVPGSTEYSLSIATKGDPQTGSLAFLLSDAKTKEVFAGDAGGLRKLDAGQVTVSPTGKITAADGYTVLNFGQASGRSKEITDLVVPTSGGAIRSNGLSRAYEGRAVRAYDAGCDCIKDNETGKTWTADEKTGAFVAADGERLAQGWKVNVGFKNFSRVLTDPNISRPFFGTLLWNFAFAIGSTGLTFLLGMAVALALHSPRMRGTNLYRVLLILPYAMPSFAMLLVWRDMFNTDFGLINNLFGLGVDWFGEAWTARAAVLLVQLWLGYPYMFLVATGALQAIPRELTEATSVDGASPWQSFRAVTLPLLLVALSPLLISSFAYNFNNVNAILLTTEGGPFPADNPTNGATDLLITYTYRLAFGAQGAEYGLATTVSVFIFAIVAVVATISFRRTRKLEEVYS